MYIYIYIYNSSIYPALPGQGQHETYKSHSNFGLVGPIIQFWQPKHLVTWTSYAKFQLHWSINEFLVGMIMSYGCGSDQATPIDVYTRD